MVSLLLTVHFALEKFLDAVFGFCVMSPYLTWLFVTSSFMLLAVFYESDIFSFFWVDLPGDLILFVTFVYVALDLLFYHVYLFLICVSCIA